LCSLVGLSYEYYKWSKLKQYQYFRIALKTLEKGFITVIFASKLRATLKKAAILEGLKMEIP
jgi:hypothetical protein